jgi:hypothetical protein
MAASDLLLAISQLAVALAGFSGLIAAIRTATPDGWYPRDIWSLSWMLGTSIGAFVVLMAWQGRRLTRSGHPPRVPYFPSAIVLLLGAASAVTGAGAAGWLHASVVPAYVGTLIALLLASALALAVFLVLLSRMTRRGP